MVAMQDAPPPLRLEITGVNPTDLPTVVVTTSVFDQLGQPVFGLGESNFAITGELADRARIISVENISDDALAFSVVLAIDTSSSMAGYPLDRAKEAAITFINSIGPNDPVAIVTFDSQERLVQDYTTDKDVLINAINNLGFGGKTSLYDGGSLAVDIAANSPTSRRAVILLSDGAEFGGLSSNAREAALQAALRQGVPIYTIGLGFGIDRSYLQDLSSNTNAKFYESPTPDELLTIYQGLAATLRSQYVITLEADIPADGKDYNLEIQATDAAGNQASASASLRAPIQVPIVQLPNLPTEPIAEPTEFSPEIIADDPITNVEIQVDGAAVQNSTEAPFAITIDPASLSPGDHNITFNVTDDDGDVGTATGDFQVAPLASTFSFVGVPDGELTEATDVTIDASGQTPVVSAAYSVDGGEPVTITTEPFAFTLDPYQFIPGQHTLNVDVTNAGGVTTSEEAPFIVGSVPPQFEITGLEAGQVVDAPVTVTATTTASQTPVQTITFAIGDTDLGTVNAPNGDVVIDPASLQPGTTTLTVTATDENGQISTQTVDFEVAALPPSITLSGINPGEGIEGSHTLTADITSQTPVTSVVYKLDGTELATQTEAPYTLDVNAAEINGGNHILTVEATNEGGQTASASVAFLSIPPTPTTTPSFTPTSGPSSTPTTEPSATPSPSPTLDLTLTAETQLQSIMTEQAISAVAAQSTLDAQSTADAQSTVSAGQTLEAQASLQAAQTQSAISTAQAAATIAPSLTAQAQATNNAQATANANASATAQAQVQANTQATMDVAGTATTAAENTANAQATADARATRDSRATAAAQQTLEAQGTLSVITTAQAEAAQAAQGTRDAQSTMTAEFKGTADAEATSEPTEETSAEVTEASASAEPTEVAQLPATPTGAATLSTAQPSLTPVELISETQGAAAGNNQIIPIAVCIAGVLVLLISLFFIVTRRRTQNTR